MSGAWKAAAHRGQLAMSVATPAFTVSRGFVLREGATLVAVIEPDDDPSFVLQFRDIARVAAWCAEMQPHRMDVLCVTLDDGEPLRLALEEMRLSGAPAVN